MIASRFGQRIIPTEPEQQQPNQSSSMSVAAPKPKECFFFVEQPDGSLGYAGFETLPDIVLFKI